MIGRSLRHYQIVQQVGEGGMGVVYKARDTHLDRFVAIKVLPHEKVADPQRKQRFVQEAKAASALNHPNVVTIYDIDADTDVDFIAMEFVSGRSLAEVIPRNGLRPSDVLRYAVPIASALAAAHTAGIIHRDLKPSNIMADGSGHVKVLDFGIAKLLEKPVGSEMPTQTAGAPITGEGSVVGTVAYMSPEQAQGLAVDQRSDIFSFGALLYEMLTGHAPFSGDTKMSTIAAILDRDPAPLPSSVPRDLERVVSRCLRKDPARRFQTMADLKVALEDLKEESESGRLGAFTPTAKSLSRRAALMAGALVLVIGAAVTGWWFTRPASVDAPAQQSGLRQLTFEAGDNSLPSLSPDGKLVAYQSDRVTPGRYDIYVQQTSGGTPIRLTSGPGNHRRPAFSGGSGSKVFFDSTGPPQGIYEVSALGGEARMIAPGADNVVVSPDGKNLAFIGRPAQQLLIMSSAGGEVRTISPEFSMLARPVWFPDSTRLAVFAQKTGQPETREWWSFPMSGPAPRQLNWVRWSGEHQYFGTPSYLGPEFTLVTLARRAGENQQIYLLRTEADDSVHGEPRAITAGAAWSGGASVANGLVAFQSGTPETGLWSLSADTDTGRVLGGLERLSTDNAVIASASSTPDGKTLVFSSNKTGTMEVHVRELDSNRDRVLTAGAPERAKNYVLVNDAGSNVVYSMNVTGAQTKWDVFEVNLAGGQPRRICEVCGPSIALVKDGTSFLSFRQDGARSRIDIVDIRTGNATAMLQSAKGPLGTVATLSPDGTHVAFTRSTTAASTDVFVTELHDARAIPEDEWIKITPEPGNVSQPFWSPNGRLLYYLMTAAGNSFLMARRLDRSGHPQEQPFRVHEFSRARPSGGTALSAVPGRFIAVLSQLDFNIWLMNSPE